MPDTISIIDFCENKECIEDNRLFVDVETVRSRRDIITRIIDLPPEPLDYDSRLGPDDFARALLSDILPVTSLAADLQTYDEAFYQLATRVYDNELLDIAGGRKHSLAAERRSPRVSLTTETLPSSSLHVPPVGRKSHRSSLTSPTQKTGGSSYHHKRPGYSREDAKLDYQIVVTGDGTTADSDASLSSTTSPSSLRDLAQPFKVLAWNNTPSCMSMQQHILRHQFADSRAAVGFDVAELIRCEGRSDEAATILELRSLQFLKLSMENDIPQMKSMLENERIHPDVADSRGFTALLGATVSPWLVSVLI